MRNTIKFLLFGCCCCLPATINAAPDLSALKEKVENPTKETLLELLVNVEEESREYRYTDRFSNIGSVDDYTMYRGLVTQENQIQCNLPTCGYHYLVKYLIDNVMPANDNNFYTEWNKNRAPQHLLNQRHCVQFSLPASLSEFYLKYTLREPYREFNRPSKLAFVAPKEGEDISATSAWTDTLAICHFEEFYPTVFSDGKVYPKTTMVSKVKLSRASNLVRMAVLEVNDIPTSTTNEFGPQWGLSELRIFDPKVCDVETSTYKALDKSVKDAYENSIANAKKDLNGTPEAIKSAYIDLQTSYQKVRDLLCVETPLTALRKLIAEVDSNLLQKSTAKGISYEGSVDDYQKHKGIVSMAEGNADNLKGSYKPDWLFDNNLSDKDNYETEWRADRVPSQAKNKNHWVQFKLDKTYKELILKFSYIAKTTDYRGPSKVAFVAPKANENLDKYADWTDTLYIGGTLPTYSTKYTDGNVRENTTFTGKIKFAHEAQNVRMAVLEVDKRDPNAKPQSWGGPTWKLSEMRLYDTSDWEENEIYKRMPEAIKIEYNAALDTAKIVADNGSVDVKEVYERLKTAHDAFNKAYLIASSIVVHMKTAQSVGDSLTFYVNPCKQGFSVDWGDGNLVNYASSATSTFHALRGQVKGENISISCSGSWTLLNAEKCKLTSIEIPTGCNLRSLYLGHNALQKISLVQMTQLNDLNCEHNALESIEFPKSANWSTTVPNLLQLNLSDNKLKGIFDFSGLQQLVYLNVAHNGITELKLDNDKLKTLLCGHNQLARTLQIKSVPSLANLLCNDNQLSIVDWANKGARAYKYVADNNKMNMLINMSAADMLKSLSCSGNNLRGVVLPGHPLEALQLAGNRMTFASLPGVDNKPRFVGFEPQDTIDISNVTGMIKEDTVTYVPLAENWADRDKHSIDMSTVSRLADNTIDIDMKWYSIAGDGTVKEMTVSTTGEEGDFCYENGKVSFFTPHDKAYVELVSNVYGTRLVSFPIKIGNIATGVESLTDEAGGLTVSTLPHALLLKSFTKVAATVVTVDGKVIWNGVVDGVVTLPVQKGIYLVNGKKIAL